MKNWLKSYVLCSHWNVQILKRKNRLGGNTQHQIKLPTAKLACVKVYYCLKMDRRIQFLLSLVWEIWPKTIGFNTNYDHKRKFAIVETIISKNLIWATTKCCHIE
jgi:hypothetical protein